MKAGLTVKEYLDGPRVRLFLEDRLSEWLEWNRSIRLETYNDNARAMGELGFVQWLIKHDLKGVRKVQTNLNLKFRKKPVVIEAFQMTEEHWESNAAWPEWMHRAWQLERETLGSLYPTKSKTGDRVPSIGTLEGQHLVSLGDWIIQGVKGELYPCKPDIFEATYEPVVD